MLADHHNDASKRQRSNPLLLPDGPFQIQLTLAELDRVRIHEEVIPRLKMKIMESILEERIMKDPVMMDGETYTVLDGMHRVAALKTLKARYIVVCVIDYDDPNIEVHRWLRSIKLKEEIEGSFSKTDIDLVPTTPEEAELRVEKGDVAAALIGRETGYICDECVSDSIESSWVMKRIESSLKDICKTIEYDSKKDAYAKLKDYSIDYLLSSIPIKKDDVIKSASTRKLYTHKSTRHMLPVRILRVDVPLDLLISDRDIQSAEEILRFHLSRRKTVYIGKNEVIDGRRYEEDVYILR